MPALAEWSWVETYGAIQTDREVVHGGNWEAAREAVERSLLESVPDAWLADRRREAAVLSGQPPAELAPCRLGLGCARTAKPR